VKIGPSDLNGLHLDLEVGSNDLKALAPSTVVRIHGIIRACFELVVTNDRITTNPAARARPPRQVEKVPESPDVDRSPNCWTDLMNDVGIRPAAVEDFTFLATMLGEAAVWRPDKATPTAEQVLADRHYALYLAGWPRQGDYGLVAEQGGPVGAAWYRTFTEASHGHGFVAEEVPELAIAVIASRRHEGIGRRLLVDLIEASQAQGYPAVGLSVAERNPARSLYESSGFVPVEKHGSTWTMIRHAAQPD
jgi:ribosomal protein S18 acetylase RimI-like enzyme